MEEEWETGRGRGAGPPASASSPGAALRKPATTIPDIRRCDPFPGRALGTGSPTLVSPLCVSCVGVCDAVVPCSHEGKFVCIFFFLNSYKQRQTNKQTEVVIGRSRASIMQRLPPVEWKSVSPPPCPPPQTRHPPLTQ